MLQDVLKGNIQLKKEAANWEEAIKIAAQPLLEKDIIEHR